VLDHVESLGGTVAAIEAGYFQQAQADFAYEVAQCRPPSRR
jgi:methylmalonyl-CoA mutase N-terminal domain/subunit